MWKEFKTFIMQGSILDLAVGVVIGGAFTNIVNMVVSGLITPIIAWIFALISDTTNTDEALSALQFRPHKGVLFDFGSVINAIITFIITGFVLFLIVKGVNKAKSLGKTAAEEPAEAAPTTDDYLKEIVELLAQQTPTEAVNVKSVETEQAIDK